MLKKLLPILFLAAAGCHKDHGNPQNISQSTSPLSPVSSTVVRTYSAFAASHSQANVAVEGFNAENNDSVSVTIPHGWSRSSMDYCNGPATPICYSLSGSTVTVTNDSAGDVSFTVQASIHI